MTERIISEMQGKTNQIQSLDLQPTFVDMLQKSSSVQFNLNAKVRLAHDGVDVKASAKRRRVAFALKKHKAFISESYSYPESSHTQVVFSWYMAFFQIVTTILTFPLRMKQQNQQLQMIWKTKAQKVLMKMSVLRAKTMKCMIRMKFWKPKRPTKQINLNRKKWKISRRLADGTISYIHIKQAIKLLLPREYISRCRQRRHWASKYLPGKDPINPKHNIQ